MTLMKNNKFRIAIAVISVVLILAGGAAYSIRDNMGPGPTEQDKALFARFDNFDFSSGKFVNREPVRYDLKKTAKRPGVWRFLFASPHAPKSKLPLDKPNFSTPPAAFSVTWMGHSFLVFELNGVRFATDPVFGNAAPVPFAVSRHAPCPIEMDELPPLDFVIVSHNHYDHLERDFIRHMAKNSTDTVFIAPPGVKKFLTKWGIPSWRTVEVNWGGHAAVRGIKVTAATARHFSGRSFSDRDTSLWAAFVIEGGGKKIFFGADGGYGSHFSEIGRLYGPFDLVLLEIDAWNDNWPDSHMRPDDALRAARELRANRLLPIHWGVFDLAGHPWSESINILTGVAEKQNVKLLTPKMGETIAPDDATTSPWWRQID
ncbi:MAG: MBL fold metallo-hydrolase [Victivallaceae bacterium]|nr:MBL fold metallo-hydrolase [Victivallaceae bacterium]